jgi:hypothetical protein
VSEPVLGKLPGDDLDNLADSCLQNNGIIDYERMDPRHRTEVFTGAKDKSLLPQIKFNSVGNA